MHFLITNDDGYGAPGLLALEKALLPLGKVTVVAPQEHLSGCSHQVTSARPLTMKQHGENHFSLDAMPADCARLGILHAAVDCDWVISGINEGANMGCDIYYSGTVAAAREAVLLGKPAIAVSHYHRGNEPIDWEQAVDWVSDLVRQLISQPPPQHGLWNVNLPSPGQLHADTPIEYCEIDSHGLAVAYDLEGETARYRHGRYHDRPRSANTDVDHCFRGAITISEVRLHGASRSEA